MREEAVRFSRINPTELQPESRFLLELDECRYTTENNCYVDKCYFLSAARAALNAGRAKKLKKKSGNRVHGKSKPKVGLRKKIRRGDTTKRSRKRTRRQLAYSGDEESRVEEASKIRRRKEAVSGSAAVVMMRSNKRFKPGD